MKFDIIIMEELKKIYPEAEIAVQDVKKTNISYKALTIRENGNPLSPAINLDDYEKRYEEGASLDMIVASIDSVYQEHKGDMSVVPEMTRENFLSHTTLKLINREKNTDKMENTPYTQYSTYGRLTAALVRKKCLTWANGPKKCLITFRLSAQS